jgi:hypothetical protein
MCFFFVRCFSIASARVYNVCWVTAVCIIDVTSRGRGDNALKFGPRGPPL